MKRAAVAALAAVATAVVTPRALECQARRDPAVQPAAEVGSGDVLVGLGGARAAGMDFPLSALHGDLLSLRLTAVVGLARRVALEVRGDLLQVLSGEPRDAPSVPLDPDARDGTTWDHGDFRVGILFAPLGGAEGLSGGGRVEVTIPSSDEKRGIGTNTTDLRLSLLGSWGGGPWRLTADAGVAILEAPLDTFEQNDVFVYAAEALRRIAGDRARLALGVEGRASTRGRVPAGTEDTGEVRAGAELRLGGWTVDTFAGLGYAGASPAWIVGAGVLRRVAGRG